MKAFEKVIGYESIKKDLMEICDMIQNRQRYDELGAKLPSGVLLHGKPGLGKTLLAKCFIEACALPTYTIRNNKGSDGFIDKITSAFEKAKQNAPAIVFLDDMDKFANEDEKHSDAKEYVAVQAGIDDVKGCDVFVIATTNDIDKLPKSLLRSGRFDRIIVMKPPTAGDAERIIKYYLKGKKVADDVNLDDLCKMMTYSSCADLEVLLNEAAMKAAYGRKEKIEMQDIIDAVLRLHYHSPGEAVWKNDEELCKVALHEAGHLVVAETLRCGSVGLASLRTQRNGRAAGFVQRCKDLGSYENDIKVVLAGKAAVELYYSERHDGGCYDDLRQAYRILFDEISECAASGLGLLDVSRNCTSESLLTRTEAVIQSELERYMFESRNIILKNRAFLEKAADALKEKETLLYSDIQAIRESVNAAGI